MKDSAYKISLDINEHGSQVVLKAKQSDTGRKVHISLRAGGTPYTIAENCYAVFTATKPDGSILYNACTIEGNEIVYEFTEQTCSAIGRSRCEIKLYGLDDKLITSPRFALLIDGTLYPDGRVESTAEFSALTQMVSDTLETQVATREATKNATEATENANEATQNANEATRNADNATENAIAATEAANQATLSAESATGIANQAAEAATQAADLANTRAAGAMIATTNADTATENANMAAKNANESAVKAANTAKSLMVVGGAKGEVIALNDAIEQYLVGLRVFGKTTQDGTPTPDAPVELASVGDKGSVTVTACCKNLARRVVSTGQTAEYATALHVDFAIKPNTTYTVSFIGTSGNELYVNETIITIPTHFDVQSGLTSVTFTTKAEIPQDQYIEAYGGWRLFKNYEDNSENKFEEFMLVEGTAAAQYEPFKGTTATVTTPNGLPGIPVSSGGNYTDANGQQWVCDEIDFARGVHVQRIGVIESYAGEAVSGLYMSSTGELTTGASVQYVLNAPVETPLSEEELTAYASLHTYRGNTTVSNDAGAWMDLEYVMDAKKYIDSIIAGGSILPATVE